MEAIKYHIQCLLAICGIIEPIGSDAFWDAFLPTPEVKFSRPYFSFKLRDLRKNGLLQKKKSPGYVLNGNTKETYNKILRKMTFQCMGPLSSS